ncbi:reverse transcriptase domain-containing protein [Tanacetum coccineum]|uniref:Reverse transcriptase domain-containing protein n=1 Tax=Tanacetum coccineum TaxID=301880 RepID=A0ABQ4XY46_9ASTR
MVTIGGRLSKDCKEQLKMLLKGNMEVFAWEPADMTGVPRKVIEHALNVNPSLDPVMGFKYKCFLDAYKGYHQIQMAKEDEEKTAFYTEQGTYCYTKMPFGLKNAGATYQRLVDSTFQNQIGRNIEAYVDDMVIKSKEETSLLADIAETFESLKTINMKLNPKKCSFGVEEGKFLGYMVTSEGIRANPKKMRVISDLKSPKTLKEMQSLGGETSFFNQQARILIDPGGEGGFSADEETNHVTSIADTTFLGRDVYSEQIHYTRPEVSPGIDDTEAWTLYTDGAASSKGSGAGLILTGPSGVEYAYALRLTFASTNNEAEYEALLAGLRIARMMNVLWIEVKVDSKLVASQVNGTYEASKGSMIKYLAKARKYISEFKTFSIENIPRGNNQKADVLSKLATVPFHHLTKEILVEVLSERSTEVQEVQTIVEEEGDNWMTPIIKYLEEGIVPSDKNEARALRAKIGQYTMESGVLFKKGYLIPMLRCVGPLQANYVIREIHMGSCGMHVGPRAVVRKAMRQGYYWPTMHADAKTEVDKLGNGHTWSVNSGQRSVILAIDYFTKWVEAKPLVKITGKEIIRFVMDNIICRYGLPRVIVTDNGAQLVSDPFKSWCTRFEIQQMNTAVAHPQANGLVERANRSLMERIKTRLGREKAGWVDELPNVLWAHRTSIKQSNGETPFSLTYGSEAVIPAEIGMPSYRTLMIMEEFNKEEQRLNLDLLQERREAAAIREARYKNEASRVEDQGKLGPKWEGPYRVTEAFENGSYKLQTMEDKIVPRTWHAINLRKCYL